jgi:hypothetical protein
MDKLRLLKSEGVRSVSLNAELYQASLHHDARSTNPRWRALEPVADFMKIFGKDTSPNEISEGENLSVEVTVKMDGRKKGGFIGQRRLDHLADHVVRESSDGFEIITKKGTPIRAEEVLVRKSVSLTIHGNTFDYKAAWHDLGMYLDELKEGGVTEM